MSSEWVTAAFTLAGSALTGALSLATVGAQRWQTRVQLAAADGQRGQELRRECYVRYQTSLLAIADEAAHVRVLFRDEERAERALQLIIDANPYLAEIQIVGPQPVAEAAMTAKSEVTHFVEVSAGLAELLSDGGEISKETEEQYEEVRNEAMAAVFAFSLTAQQALGLSNLQVTIPKQRMRTGWLRRGA